MKKKLILFFFVIFSALIVGRADADNANSLDLERDSNQYISVSDASQFGLDITGDTTIEAWIKIESIGADVQTIVSKFVVGQKSYFFDYIEADDKLRFMLSNNGSGDEALLSSVKLGLSTGAWYHIAVSWNRSTSTAKFYKNGSQLGTDVVGSFTSIYNGTGSFSIGARNSSSFLDGKIDDVRIWNRVRTAAEIAADYQKELAGNESGLVGYWKFNGNTNDSTANGNNLTNNGGAIFSTDVPFSGTTTTTPPPPTVLICSIGNPVDVNSVSDINGNNFPETVTLGYNSSNIPTVCFADVSTSAFIKELQFFAAGWILKDMFLAPDMSSPADGIPDISVMATNGNLNKIQIKDAVSGALIKEITLP